MAVIQLIPSAIIVNMQVSRLKLLAKHTINATTLSMKMVLKTALFRLGILYRSFTILATLTNLSHKKRATVKPP